MSDNHPDGPILINKYSNRRYYDTRNSRHVTLQDVYDLVMGGKDVCIMDSQSGEDLTNVVLLQILLERDHPKFDLFPSSLMHMMLRSSRNSLRSTVERFFGPFLGMMAAGQKQFDSYIRDAMKRMPAMEWTRNMMRGFGEVDSWKPPEDGSVDHQRADHEPAIATPPGELDELRKELASVRREMATLAAEKSGKTRKSKSTPRRKARR